MALCNNLIGATVVLRCVDEDDAEYILSLRNNPEISKYLPQIDVSLEQQKAWIRKQREDPTDFYFIIAEKTTDKPIGTISIYNWQGESSEGGRFACTGDSEQIVESSLLLYDFAFSVLNIRRVDAWVFKENKSVLRFNNKLGITFEEGEHQGVSCMVGVLTPEGFYTTTKKMREHFAKKMILITNNLILNKD